MNNFSTLITIAIPVYERKEFFIEALESALNQTVKCKVLVVDNASSHNYFESVCKDKGILFYKNERNVGVFPNWNKCIQYADSEYVLILGDDDILDKDYVFNFLQAKKFHDDIDIFFSDFLILDNEKNILKNHKHILPFGYMSNGERVIEFGAKYRLGFPIISSAIRKSIFNGFFEEGHGSNDWAWLYGNVKNLVVYGETKKLLKYRQHKSNDSKNPETIIQVHLSIWYIYKVILPSFIDKNQKKISKKIVLSQRLSCFYLFTHIQKDFFKVLIKKNNRYSLFLKKEYNSNFILKCFILFPYNFRISIYKFLNRLKIIK